jgi:hypothetical protein
MKKAFPILNILGFIAVLAGNYLAATGALNNQTTGAASDRYPNLFTPAGFTFSIWGIIYLLLLTFIIIQTTTLFRKNAANSSAIEAIGPWFFISCVANTSWLYAWHYDNIPLSMAIMLALLASLLQIYLRLGIGRTGASRTVRLGIHLPFSVYLGWITVATIANASILLVSQGWGGWGISPANWAAVMIAAGVVIGLSMLFLRRDLGYALVLVWAFYGIWSARSVEGQEAAPVASAALMAIIALVVSTAVAGWKRMRA